MPDWGPGGPAGRINDLLNLMISAGGGGMRNVGFGGGPASGGNGAHFPGQGRQLGGQSANFGRRDESNEASRKRPRK